MKRKIKITGLPKAASGLESKMNNLRAGLGFNANVMPWPIMAGKMSKPDVAVKKVLGPVAREGANLEAEKGEIAMVPTEDGVPSTYMIGGKRHHQGGTPLNLPVNSFIFSDTAKMRIKDPVILAQFGMPAKKGGYTPAEIAKRYDINEYKKILADPDSDILQRETAELMIKNNNIKLAKLALIQESMKGFPQGIPAIAIPYIESMQIDLNEFLNVEQRMNETFGSDEEEEASQEGMDTEGMQDETAEGDNMSYGGILRKLKMRKGGDVFGLYRAQDGLFTWEEKKKHEKPLSEDNPGMRKDAFYDILYYDDAARKKGSIPGFNNAEDWNTFLSSQKPSIRTILQNYPETLSSWNTDAMRNLANELEKVDVDWSWDIIPGSDQDVIEENLPDILRARAKAIESPSLPTPVETFDDYGRKINIIRERLERQREKLAPDDYDKRIKIDTKLAQLMDMDPTYRINNPGARPGSTMLQYSASDVGAPTVSDAKGVYEKLKTHEYSKPGWLTNTLRGWEGPNMPTDKTWDEGAFDMYINYTPDEKKVIDSEWSTIYGDMTTSDYDKQNKEAQEAIDEIKKKVAEKGPEILNAKLADPDVGTYNKRLYQLDAEGNPIMTTEGEYEYPVFLPAVQDSFEKGLLKIVPDEEYKKIISDSTKTKQKMKEGGLIGTRKIRIVGLPQFDPGGNNDNVPDYKKMVGKKVKSSGSKGSTAPKGGGGGDSFVVWDPESEWFKEYTTAVGPDADYESSLPSTYMEYKKTGIKPERKKTQGSYKDSSGKTPYNIAGRRHWWTGAEKADFEARHPDFIKQKPDFNPTDNTVIGTWPAGTMINGKDVSGTTMTKGKKDVYDFQIWYDQEAKKKGIKKPYFGGVRENEGVDATFGEHTWSAPGLNPKQKKKEEDKKTTTITETTTKKGDTPLGPPKVTHMGPPLPRPPAPYQNIDVDNMAFLAGQHAGIKGFYPWMAPYIASTPDTVYFSPDQGINARQALQAQELNKLAGFGPRSFNARAAETTGRSFTDIAGHIANIQNANVQIANTAAAQNAQIRNDEALKKAIGNTELYDRYQKVNAGLYNTRRKSAATMQAFRTAAEKNRANIFNMNVMYPNAAINEEGMYVFHDPRMLRPDFSQEKSADQYYEDMLEQHPTWRGTPEGRKMAWEAAKLKANIRTPQDPYLSYKQRGVIPSYNPEDYDDNEDNYGS